MHQMIIFCDSVCHMCEPDHFIVDLHDADGDGVGPVLTPILRLLKQHGQGPLVNARVLLVSLMKAMLNAKSVYYRYFKLTPLDFNFFERETLIKL